MTTSCEIVNRSFSNALYYGMMQKVNGRYPKDSFFDVEPQEKPELDEESRD